MDDPTDSDRPLRLGRIFALWLPLAASWALMTVEYPIIQAAIARLPDAEVMFAAASLLIGLQITIESPVIMLLATTTALAKGPASYHVLRRFTLHLNLGCTVLAALVALIDPLYDVVIRSLLGIPDVIAREARPGFVIMILWSAAIGWRRFNQGILIRAGRTRLVGAGTFVRLVFAAGTALSLALSGAVTGVVVGAWAWMAGVVSEALFSAWVVRGTVRERYGPEAPEEEQPPTYGDVARYHAPLAATSLLALLAMPLLQAGLSRMPQPEENLAAWPVLFAVLLLFRSPGFALPEAVIALLTRPDRVAAIRRFSMLLAAAVVALLALFVVSPLLDIYLESALDVPTKLLPFVLPGLLAGMLIPALQTLQAWYRGVLMTARVTQHVYWGMGIALTTTFVAVVAAVLLQTSGVVSCAIALSLGMVLESVYIGYRARRALATMRFD
jgi:hypothetical protein